MQGVARERVDSPHTASLAVGGRSSDIVGTDMGTREDLIRSLKP